MPECININRRITACRTPEACPASSSLHECLWHGTERNETLSHAIFTAGHTEGIHGRSLAACGLAKVLLIKAWRQMRSCC